MVHKINYLGSYDASYARHRIIQRGLNELGYSIQEVRDQRSLPVRWFAMSRHLFSIPRYEPIVVGESSNYLFPVLFTSRLMGNPPVFDTFVSLKDTFSDRATHPSGKLLSVCGGILDRLNCWAAKAVVFDTAQTLTYFVRELGINAAKSHIVYVGAETSLFVPQPPRIRDGCLRVLFYGTFIPLHGIDVILGAASIIQTVRDDIQFKLIGDGQERQRLWDRARSLQLTNLEFGPRHVPYEQLPELIASSDICLGIFANRPKTKRVVPHKAFQAAASSRVLVTADTPGIREVFSDETAVLVEPGNSVSLAKAIIRIADDEQHRQQIAARGSELVHSDYGPQAIAQQLLRAIAGWNAEESK
jgi:glycosyltransferase involved in cell wall biosynthesis